MAVSHYVDLFWITGNTKHHPIQYVAEPMD
jgi:hypothetical protein